MNTQISRNVLRLTIVITFLACISLSNELHSQTFNRRAVTQQARVVAATTGLKSASFSSQAISNLTDGAAGVKFSNGLVGRRGVLMAIGVDANGNEIGDQFIQSKGAPIGRATMEAQVKAISDHQLFQHFTSSFSSSDLESMIEAAGSEGSIFLYPSTNDQDALTLLAAPSTSLSPIKINDSMFRRSPCPPDCDF